MENCTYCKSDMKYGTEIQTIAMTWDATTSPALADKMLGRRVICWPCQFKMLDWVAKQATPYGELNEH